MAAKKKTPVGEAPAGDDMTGMPPEFTNFHVRLERELKARLGENYSQTAVALASGVSQPTVSNLLKKPERTKFRLGTVLKIAKALDISLDVLLLDRSDPWKIITRISSTGQTRVRVDPAPKAPESPPTPQKKRGQQP